MKLFFKWEDYPNAVSPIKIVIGGRRMRKSTACALRAVDFLLQHDVCQLVLMRPTATSLTASTGWFNPIITHYPEKFKKLVKKIFDIDEYERVFFSRSLTKNSMDFNVISNGKRFKRRAFILLLSLEIKDNEFSKSNVNGDIPTLIVMEEVILFNGKPSQTRASLSRLWEILFCFAHKVSETQFEFKQTEVILIGNTLPTLPVFERFIGIKPNLSTIYSTQLTNKGFYCDYFRFKGGESYESGNVIIENLRKFSQNDISNMVCFASFSFKGNLYYASSFGFNKTAITRAKPPRLIDYWGLDRLMEIPFEKVYFENDKCADAYYDFCLRG